MSEAIETRSFRYKDVIVRYSKSEREEYVVCIERLDKEICHLFSLGSLLISIIDLVCGMLFINEGVGFN